MSESTTVLDCHGERWNLKLTLGRAASIGEACGVDVFSDDFAARLEAAGAPNILFAAYTLASPECVRQGLSRDEFLDRFQGTDEVVALMSAARVSIQHFFQTFAAPVRAAANAKAPEPGRAACAGTGAPRTSSPRAPASKTSAASRSAN
jgi:hypothetical protein